jgi:hypothetical protein
MADWLPGVTRITSDHDGGSMLGGPPRFVWHTYECAASVTVERAAQALISAGNEVHFVLHPAGGLVQILPSSVAGRGLKNASGGVQTNRQGTICLQVEVIAFAADPFTRNLTAKGLADVRRMVAFGRSLGVPDVWPAGPPPAYPTGSSARSAAIWTAHGGHYGHSQVPENDHGDPGAIDTALLLSTAPPPLTPTEDTMLVHVTKTSTDGTLPATAIVLVAGNTRYWLPGNGAALVNDFKAKGGIVPDMTGDDLIRCFPVDLRQQGDGTAKVLAAVAGVRAALPAPIDVPALAAAIAAAVPVAEVTKDVVESAIREVLGSLDTPAA